MIGVSQKTINRWKLQHVEFVTALKSGKAPADERVVQSLYQRALGYDHNGKHYPPDVTACIFWLKNRAPEEWRDRREEHHTIVQDNRTAAEVFADLQRDMAEMGLDLVPRDDGSFALLQFAMQASVNGHVFIRSSQIHPSAILTSRHVL